MTTVRSHYYDRNGRPLWDDIMTWGKLRDDEATFRLGLDDVGPATITTVWQGMNLVIGADPPKIFETRIFGGKHDLSGTHYATEVEALDGHQQAVEDLEAGRPPWWLDGDQ